MKTACFLALLSLIGRPVGAQGGSAVVTLVMPPPGGEGYSSMQSGGVFATGAASMYYNPASLAMLERSTGSQLHFLHARQNLLPALQLDDLRQEFRGFAAVAPDPLQGFDVGMGFFSNYVSFGDFSDWNGRIYHSDERVYALGIAARLGAPISVGGTVKFIDSQPARGFSPGARSWAFDLGLLVNPRLLPCKPLGLHTIEVMPALGITAHNLGPEVFYVESMNSDPIPYGYRGALGLQVRLFDLAEFAAGRDVEKDALRNDSPWYRSIIIRGYSMRFLLYRFSQSWLDDPDGRRDERHSSHALEFNLLDVMRLRKRLATRDFHSPPEAMESGHPFAKISVGGFSFRANPRFTLGSRRIQSRDREIRDGQKAFFLAFSL